MICEAAGIADLDEALLFDIDDFGGFNRQRNMPVRTGLGGLAVSAKAGDDATIALIDDINTAAQPDQRQRAANAAPIFGSENRSLWS